MSAGERSDLGELVTVRAADGSSAVVALHGGHVVSWRTADGRERLFLSDRATTAGGAAIRGGIPVCFPQFAGHGSLPKHGFARTAAWTATGPATFELRIGSADWPGWPHACLLGIEVLLGPSTLTTVLRVANTGTTALSFTGALHSYLACGEVGRVSVSGLEGLAVFDGGSIDGPITFPDPAIDVDLSILDAVSPVRVEGLDASGRTMVAAQTGFPDVVVWNIGSTLGATMGDLGDEQWSEYVCVEAAVVDDAVTVTPGATWTGSQTLTVL